MKKIEVAPEDFKNAVEAMWQLLREVESKAGKDALALRFVKQSEEFCKRMMEKYPTVFL